MTDDEAAACIRRQLNEMFPDDCDSDDIETNVRRIADALEAALPALREIAGALA